MSPIFIILAIILVIILWVVFAYNSFIRFINRAKEAWADIDVQLKRRYDLIPNLVNTVKGYAKHESSAFENVTKARSMAMGALVTFSNALDSCLAYPLTVLTK